MTACPQCHRDACARGLLCDGAPPPLAPFPCTDDLEDQRPVPASAQVSATQRLLNWATRIVCSGFFSPRDREHVRALVAEADLEQHRRASASPADDYRAWYTACAEAAGIMHEPDTGPTAPGPVEAVVEEIRVLKKAMSDEADRRIPRERASWHEDDGVVMWWAFPVREPPYVGSELDDDFPEYVTHWTPMPRLPFEVPDMPDERLKVFKDSMMKNPPVPIQHPELRPSNASPEQFDSGEWFEQGPMCTRCHETIGWDGDPPETAEDAICHTCAWAELEAARARLATGSPSTRAADNEHFVEGYEAGKKKGGDWWRSENARISHENDVLRSRAAAAEEEADESRATAETLQAELDRLRPSAAQPGAADGPPGEGSAAGYWRTRALVAETLNKSAGETTKGRGNGE